MRISDCGMESDGHDPRATSHQKAQWPNKANSSQAVRGQVVNVVVAAHGAERRTEEKTRNVESSIIQSPTGGRLRRALLPSGKRGAWALIAHILCPWCAHRPCRRRRGGSMIAGEVGTLFALSPNVRHLRTDGPRSAENQGGRHAVEEGKRELVKSIQRVRSNVRRSEADGQGRSSIDELTGSRDSLEKSANGRRGIIRRERRGRLSRAVISPSIPDTKTFLEIGPSQKDEPAESSQVSPRPCLRTNVVSATRRRT